jgi:prephenate dehydrogenase
MKTLSIVGIGLMGASLALALKQRALRNGQVLWRIVGVSRSAETQQKALARGIVDEATTELAVGVKDADVVVLCTPVRLLIEQIGQLGGLCKPGTVITDMGSTKTEIVRTMNALPAHLFAVGSHPMCGKEMAGIDVAEASLYENAPWILTRTERTSPESFALVKNLAESVGAKTREIDVARHDALLAFASHLPYVLATSMVATTDAYAINQSAAEVWQVMAGGFRDTSRVAASDVTMWLDILLTNADAVLNAVRDFQFQLDQFTAMLERKDEAGLKAFMAQAAAARKAKYG